ncbi:MAG: transporting ATPase [Porticoccaceae bacterium]|nr:MAG: transporting ATPase [Porticoccaceae bacterium]
MRGSPGEHRAADLERLFAREFAASHQTLLVGGAPEPLYLPAAHGRRWHLLHYREDFFASALHEVAHWCIAGPARRRRVDFGYWYAPEGRDARQQAAFERVEVAPQALEWIFAEAAGAHFAPSSDNLDSGVERPSASFLAALAQRARDWCREGLPARAARFVRALEAFYGTRGALDPGRYREEALGVRHP